MLLITITINGTDHFVSLDGHRLTHNWKALVAAMSPCQMQSTHGHGGYVRLSFGTIDFSPDLFSGDDWPPPQQCDITVQYTSTNEAAAVTYFVGEAYLRKVARERVTYDLHSPAYAAEIASGTAYNDTLVNVMTALATALGLSLDSSAARSPSPAIVYTTTQDRLAIDLANSMTAFYAHLFYIVGSTLYLVDCLADNGSRTLSEQDFFPSDIHKDLPTAEITDGTNSSFSAYSYGQTVAQAAYHDVPANIVSAFDDILTVLNLDRAKLRLPLSGDLPVPGERINWIDTTLRMDSEAWIRAMSLSYDFAGHEVVVDGKGRLTALNALLVETSGDYMLAANGATVSITRSREISDAPAFSPASGDITSDPLVTITAGGGATIYYTLDGSEPRTDSAVYTSPVCIFGNKTLRAIAIEPGKLRAETSADFEGPPANPVTFVADASGHDLSGTYYTNLNTGKYGRDLGYISHVCFLFQDITLPPGATITACYLIMRGKSDGWGGPNVGSSVNVNYGFEDLADAALPASLAEFNALDLTTLVNETLGYFPMSPVSEVNSASLVTPMQELIDKPDWVYKNDILIAIKNGTGNDGNEYRTIECPINTQYPKLYVEFSV